MTAFFLRLSISHALLHADFICLAHILVCILAFVR
jgi:hypothetical protein